MSQTTEPSDDDLLEALVAQCVERGGQEPDSMVAEVCSGNPELGSRGKERLAVLRRFGLVGADGPDRTIGDYRLVDELGAGGMGVVWLAEHMESGRRVALKTADPRMPWTERMRERFLREVRAASRLDHPHVVPIDDMGEERGIPFYTMPVVEGATLRELLASMKHVNTAGPPDLETFLGAWRAVLGDENAAAPARWGPTYVSAVTRLALDVAEALAHTHANGVVHRDVKPGNVLVDHEGRAILFDLGLAHVADDPALTRTGDFTGSPHYASPEQVAGAHGSIDGRADVYSLGVSLFEAVVLAPPFEAAATPALLRMIAQREAPSLRARSPLAPRDLDTIVATCLEKEPRQRYGSAEELADDLRRFLRFEPIVARPLGGARRLARRLRRNPAWAAAGLLAAGILIAAPLGLWQHERSLRREWERAERAADAAQREADENREVSRFLESLWIQLDESGDSVHAEVSRDLFELAVDRAERDATIATRTRANLLVTLARVFHGTGRDAEAVPLLDRAFWHRQRELGDDHPHTADVLRQLAEVHLALGNADQALALARRGEAIYRGELADDPQAPVARLALVRALRIANAHDLDGAAGLLDQVQVALESAGEGRSTNAARVLLERGELALARGEVQVAIEALEESRRVLAEQTAPPLADLAEISLALGHARARAGEIEPAIEVWRAALRLFRQAGGDRSPRVAGVVRLLVDAERGSLDPAEGDEARALAEHLRLLAESGSPTALDELHQAVELLRPFAGEVSPELGVTLAALARRTADLQEKRRLLLEARSHASRRPLLPELWELEVLQALAASDPHPASVLLEGVVLLERRGVELEGEWADAALRHIELLVAAGRTAAAPRLFALFGTPSGDTPEPGGDERFEAAFQSGITALQSGYHDAAADAFRSCLELREGAPAAAYNLACALALGGKREEALEALALSTEVGYAYRELAPDRTLEDADLVSLRGDPRFDSIVARMVELRARAEAFSSVPGVWVPEGEPGPLPLLVVLHGAGETPADVMEGPWRSVAERLGYALLAPSGRLPIGTEPAQGMSWAEDLDSYGQRSWHYERTIREAYQSFLGEHEVDPLRVFVAGEGLGAAVAFNVALHAPELYRGVLLVDGRVHEGLAAEKAPHLGSMGLRVTLLADLPERAEPTADTFALLRDWGIRASVGDCPGTKEEDESSERTLALLRAVRWLEGL